MSGDDDGAPAAAAGPRGPRPPRASHQAAAPSPNASPAVANAHYEQASQFFLQTMFQMSRSFNEEILFLAGISLLFLRNTNPHERIHEDEALHRSMVKLRRPWQTLARSRRIFGLSRFHPAAARGKR